MAVKVKITAINIFLSLLECYGNVHTRTHFLNKDCEKYHHPHENVKYSLEDNPEHLKKTGKPEMAEKRDFKDFFLDIARHNLNFLIERVSENHNLEKTFFRGLIFSDLKMLFIC